MVGFFEKIVFCKKMKKQHTEGFFGVSRVCVFFLCDIFFKKCEKKLARETKISIIVFVDDEFKASSKRESLIQRWF